MKEEDKDLLFLISLPNSYDNLVKTVLFEKDTINLEDVMTSFLYNEIRKTNFEGCQEFGLIGLVEKYKGKSFVRGSRSSRSKSKSKGNDKV